MNSAVEVSRLNLKRPGLLHDACFIDGAWISGEARIEVLNPATGRTLGSIPRFGAAEAEKAVEAAHTALPAWRERTGKERAQVLRRWFELILENGDDLARLMTSEQGKPLAEARGEIAYAAAYIEWFAEEAKRVYGDTIPGHGRDLRLVVIKQPVGVVAAITPWNFPAAMITRKVGAALAAGCTIVLKPSDLTPFSALALADLAYEAGVPRGVFNVVTGEAESIGEVLTTDKRVRKFTFTGSTPVGKMLAARCMGTVKRVSLELGGNAPFIVFNDADIDRAISGVMASKFRNTGQTCVCANRILVQAGVYDIFAEKLAARAAALICGDGLEGATDQGPLINAAAVAKVRRHIAQAVENGAKVIAGGPPDVQDGLFFPPTVLTAVTSQMEVAHEETFGPVAALLKFETEADALRIANDISAGLAAYVFTRDMGRSWRMGEGLEFGMVGINTGLISTELAPFGGIKESGFGREGSRYGVEDYVDVKYLCMSIDAEPGA